MKQRFLTVFAILMCSACHVDSGDAPPGIEGSAGGGGAFQGAAGQTNATGGAVSGNGGSNPQDLNPPPGKGGLGGEANVDASAGSAGSAGSPATFDGPPIDVPVARVIPFTNILSKSYTQGCGKPAVQAGTTTEVPGGYDLTAYGQEMGFHCSDDHGHFAYIEVSGDFDMVVQVASAGTENNEHHTRAGILARKLTLGPRDPFVNVAVASNYTQNNFADLRHFAARKAPGARLESADFRYHVDQRDAPDHHSKLPFPRNFPHEWLWLQRRGTLWNAWYNFDGGTTWNPHRVHHGDLPKDDPTHTVDLGETVALGIYLEGQPEHLWTVKTMASFRNIRITAPH